MSSARDAEVARWAAPQQRFEALLARKRRGAGRSICDLAYANPYDGAPPEVREALHQAIDRDRLLDLQYTPYGGATIPRRLVAQALRETHGIEFGWRDVVLTPGAMAGLNVLFRSLATDGVDEVIVPVPCWLDYPLYLANLGMKPVLVPLERKRFDLDLDAIAAALGPNTRALVLSQPGNPTGRLYARSELEALGRLLDASPARPLLISDECHRDVLFEGAKFTSPAAVYDRTCIVYSFGKQLSIQGQRLGYVAVSPRMDADEEGSVSAERLETLCRAMGICTPTSLMQAALGALLKVRRDWSDIALRRRRVLDAFSEAGTDVVASDATFFLYARTGAWPDFDLVEALADKGVFVLPSALFHDRGHVRLSLTCSDEMLERALPVLASTLAERARV